MWPADAPAAGAQFRNGGVDAVSFSTLNLQGRGVTLVGMAEHGGAYRPGAGVLLAKHGLLDRPAVVTLAAERHPVGGLLGLGVAAPFPVDAQRHGMRAGRSMMSRGSGASGASGAGASVSPGCS